MRHRRGNKKLSKPTDQRIAMLRALVISLFKHNQIKTTDTRAKEARRMAEKLITLAKKGDLAARRQALKVLPDKEAIKTAFETLAKRYESRNGGFSRITKLGFRRGDAAPVSLVELID